MRGIRHRVQADGEVRVGALARPSVPAGDVRTFFDALHDLHHRAGWPSLRDLAREVGCSRTTVSAAFSQPRVPRWGLVELLVEALDGDVERFREYWLAATAGQQAAAPGTGEGVAGTGAGEWQPLRQLPADVAAFSGRGQELRRLDDLLDRRDAAQPAMVVAVVCGTAGVGKTALAVHWAHRRLSSFPDGQLYVNLRGYDPGQPLTAGEALEQLLRAAGLPGSAIPIGLAERAARYRTLLAGRRVLLVLDNASSVDQVRELLPGSGSCFVIVTSRDTLPALVARHGAVRLTVDLLPAEDSLRLLSELLDGRVREAPADAAALAQRCAHLPLALRLAAELCSSRPHDSLRDLVAELDREPDRLDLLAAADDDYTAVRAVFSWSYAHLSPSAADAFRVIGLHPGTGLSTAAAAAMLGTEPRAASRLLDTLARAHLVIRGAGGRYVMHDLLRSYAAELATELEKTARDEALRRLFEHYLDTAETAVGAAFPGPSGGPTRSVSAPPPDASPWVTWLDTERANLLAAAAAAAAAPSPSAAAAVTASAADTAARREKWEFVTRLSATLTVYLDAGAHYEDALTLHGLAVRAALASGDAAGRAAALNALGLVRRRRGEYAVALHLHEEALAIQRELQDDAGEGKTLHSMGVIEWRRGRYDEARAHLLAALRRHRASGDRVGEAAALSSLGIVHRRLGDYGQALATQQAALALAREAGDGAGAARALNNAGVVFLRMARYGDAIAHLEEALAIHRASRDLVAQCVALINLGLSREGLGDLEVASRQVSEALVLARATGYRAGEGDALRGLGVVATRLGRLSDAVSLLTEAVALGRAIGEAEVETGALNELGRALTAAGRPQDAVVRHEEALALASRSRDRYEQARALDGLAGALRESGEPALAEERASAARATMAALGLPESALV